MGAVACIDFKNFPFDTTHSFCTPLDFLVRTRNHFVDLFVFHNQPGENVVGIEAAANANSIELNRTAYSDLYCPSSFGLKIYHAATSHQNQLWNVSDEGDH